MDEQWKNIDGTDYAVSNLGRVASMKHNKWKVLNPSKDTCGYLQITLSCSGESRKHSVHRLVALAFLPESPTGGNEVNHRDGNKANNQSNNLEWATRSENIKHSYSVLGVRGRTGPARLTETAVRVIRARHKLGDGLRGLAIAYGVSYMTIHNATHGNTWRGVV
jgi:hypothetical protein